jgi:hypothetical protein
MSEFIPPPFDELPELMLSLRSLGSRRRVPIDTAGLEDQERFFAPLLAGRRSAAQAVSRTQVVAAFDARRLTAMMDAAVRAFAADRFTKGAPALRAFEAELFEILEPLRESLQALRYLAEEVPPGPESPEQYEQWTRWLAQLRIVFRVADASWPALSVALGSSPRLPAPKARRSGPSGGDQR